MCLSVLVCSSPSAPACMRRCACVACLRRLRYGQVSREANSSALVVFSKTTCPFCEEAKGVLQGELGAAYAAVKVIELDQLGPAAPRRELSSALLALTGMSTVPNIFLEGESLGGCSELKALLSSEPDRVRARLLDAGACTVRVGDRVPSAQVKVVEAGEDGAARVRDVDSAELVRGQNGIIFGVPAAFSPSCSEKHLPSFLNNLDALRGKGVRFVYCLAVNDAHVLKAWATASRALGRLAFIADGNGELARKMGLLADATKAGMGHRSRRFALVIRDGTVLHAAVDAPMQTHVSTADALLRQDVLARPLAKL